MTTVTRIPAPAGHDHQPHRRLFVGAAALIALAGAAGAVQLLTGTFTPPVADLEPLGLTS